jgi:hypothetical protein
MLILALLALFVENLLDTCSIPVPKDVESYALTHESTFPLSTSKLLHFLPFCTDLPMDTYSILTCKDVEDSPLIHEGKFSSLLN